MALGDCQDFPATRLTHHAGGRVLKGRLQVDQPRPVTLQRHRQQVGAHPLGVDGHTDDPGSQRVQGAQSTGVGRFLDHHRIAGIDHHPEHQLQRLLSAVGDQHLIGVECRALLAHRAGDPAAQRLMAGGGAVAEEFLAGFLHRTADRFTQRLHRHQVTGRIGAGERDALVRGDHAIHRKQATDAGALHRSGEPAEPGSSVPGGGSRRFVVPTRGHQKGAAAGVALNQPLLGQGVVGRDDGIAVDAQAPGQIPGGRQPGTRGQLALFEATADGIGDLPVDRDGALEIDLELVEHSGVHRLGLTRLA